MKLAIINMMKNTYEAIIDGDKVTWVGDRPMFNGQARVRVKIELMSENGTPNGEIIARRIRKFIAETGGLTSIEDAVEWQREQRKDRPLPGRE